MRSFFEGIKAWVVDLFGPRRYDYDEEEVEPFDEDDCFYEIFMSCFYDARADEEAFRLALDIMAAVDIANANVCDEEQIIV